MRRFFTFLSLGFIFPHINAQQASNAAIDANPAINSTEPGFAETKVYPNPTDSKLYFSTSDRMNGDIVRIFSVLGTEMMSYELQATHEALDVSPLQRGIYLYRIIDKNEKTIVTGKFDKR